MQCRMLSPSLEWRAWKTWMPTIWNIFIEHHYGMTIWTSFLAGFYCHHRYVTIFCSCSNYQTYSMPFNISTFFFFIVTFGPTSSWVCENWWNYIATPWPDGQHRYSSHGTSHAGRPSVEHSTFLKCMWVDVFLYQLQQDKCTIMCMAVGCCVV